MLDDLKKFLIATPDAGELRAWTCRRLCKGFRSEKVQADIAAKLPGGKASALALTEPEKISGLEMQVIKKNTPGTAISLGFPIAVTRSDRTGRPPACFSHISANTDPATAILIRG